MLAIRKLECKTAVFLLCSRMQSLVKREVIYPEMCATTKWKICVKIHRRFERNSKRSEGAPWKVAILTKMANMAKIYRRLCKNSNEMFKEAPWKVAILTNMGKMAIVPKICQRLSKTKNGEYGKCSENLADSPYSPLRAFLVILGAGKARENPRSFI